MTHTTTSLHSLSPRGRLAASVLAILLGASGAQAWAAELPAVKTQGTIEYVSGGIGVDEAQAMQDAARQWPLTLEFGIQDGRGAAFAANVEVKVRDAKGKTVLETTAQGPYLLAKLAPGSYTVDATVQGKTLTRKVQIKAKAPARATFLWPKGTDGVQSGPAPTAEEKSADH